MNPFAKWRIYKSIFGDGRVEVVERDGVRSLHLGSATVQSAMRTDAPNELLLSYTRSMMAFLLFHESPRHIVLLGLGGGSLAKFIYHQMPCAAITAIEVNPRVAELARSHFLLPDDDKRLRVVLADGASWVAQHCASADVIMVDAYDGDAHVERLCSEDFYLDCVRALEADGVLVANVWANDRRFARILARIATAFPAGNACLPAKKPGNVIVIGFQSSPGELRWRDLKLRARLLEQRYGLEFVDFVDALRKMNPHDHKCLRL